MRRRNAARGIGIGRGRGERRRRKEQRRGRKQSELGLGASSGRGASSGHSGGASSGRNASSGHGASSGRGASSGCGVSSGSSLRDTPEEEHSSLAPPKSKRQKIAEAARLNELYDESNEEIVLDTLAVRDNALEAASAAAAGRANTVSGASSGSDASSFNFAAMIERGVPREQAEKARRRHLAYINTQRASLEHAINAHRHQLDRTSDTTRRSELQTELNTVIARARGFVSRERGNAELDALLQLCKRCVIFRS